MGKIGDEVEKLYGHDLEEKKKQGSSGSNKNKNPALIYIAVGVAAAIIFVAGIFYWNKFIVLQQMVLTKQGQMEKEYQRRNDLIPNLIEVAGDYAHHERELFRYVSDVRAGLESAENLMKAMKKIEKTKGKNILSKVMALAEQYPDLKATQSFQELMDKLEEQEDRLADTREAYNKASRVYNTAIASFPSGFFNIFFRFKMAPYFSATEKQVVRIDDVKNSKSFRKGVIKEENDGRK